MPNRILQAARRALTAFFGNAGIYMFAAFLFVGPLTSEILVWYKEPIDTLMRYVVDPWGVALVLLEMNRRTRRELKPRADMLTLTALLAWLIVPFLIRFGATFNNLVCMFGYTAVMMGVYAALACAEAPRRERMWDCALALFTLLALALGGALMVCAVKGCAFDAGTDGTPFGVVRLVDGFALCMGLHYNITGMIMLCCCMLSIAFAARRRNPLLRAAGVVGALLTALVVVLTQSRTARYALLIALAVGVYGVVIGGRWIKGRVWRHAAGILLACAVLLAGNAASDKLIYGVFGRHVPGFARTETTSFVRTAEAEDETASPAPEVPQISRGAADSTLSGRSAIWKGVFKYWKANPKLLVIGTGSGRTGSRFFPYIEDTPAIVGMKAIAVHNAYLQFTADFGLIGLALLIAFLASIARPMLKAFFAPAGKRRPDDVALAMTIVAMLAVGMMESAPLGALTHCNLCLFGALAMLASHGRTEEIA